MANERCPRCFSRISDFETGEVRWTDDPIKTPKGEAGEDYIGFIYMTPIHIEELQQLRQQQEIDIGIAEEDRTSFTPVRVEGERVWFYKKHLRELRESTEKILNTTGQIKEEYFNYDEEGTEYNIGDHQLDWKDSDLTQKFLDIKAVHIEDLRHYLITGWIETFDKTVGFPFGFFGGAPFSTRTGTWGDVTFDWDWFIDGGYTSHQLAFVKWEIKGEENSKYIRFTSKAVSEIEEEYADTTFSMRFSSQLSLITSHSRLITIGTSIQFSGSSGLGVGYVVGIQMTFSNGNYLTYSSNLGEVSPPWVEQESIITVDDITNMDRDLYKDYCDEWGIINKDTFNSLTIGSFILWQKIRSFPEQTCDIDYALDSIKIF